MKKLILLSLLLTACTDTSKYLPNESIEYCNFYTPEQNGNKDTWYMETVTGHYYFKQNYDLNQDGIVIAVFVNSNFVRVEDN